MHLNPTMASLDSGSVIDSLFIVASIVCVGFAFSEILCVLSRFAIVSPRKRELVALLK